MHELASTLKVAYHKEKIDDYLSEKFIFPATLELDITGACTRRCDCCPSTRGLGKTELNIEFVRKLFSFLKGKTEGLLLSGGEPTMSQFFPEVLRLARSSRFIDIAVVTNGSLLGKKNVQDVLLAFASTIRISMYDWYGGSNKAMMQTLRRIEILRKRIDSEGSCLQIGVSVLTSKDYIPQMLEVTELVRKAGAHWIYFHPTCINWDTGRPEQLGQEGVLAKIEDYKSDLKNGFGVYILRDRYRTEALNFKEYHAAHFLLVIGADGLNYLGAEVKYNPKHVIADVQGKWDNRFLWNPERLQRIKSFTSRNYGALGSRHRGALYSQKIEGMKNRKEASIAEISGNTNSSFIFPHIL
jgi:MoaA/NifB/PqqE/SkfB family radical SAM enzyme